MYYPTAKFGDDMPGVSVFLFQNADIHIHACTEPLKRPITHVGDYVQVCVSIVTVIQPQHYMLTKNKSSNVALQSFAFSLQVAKLISFPINRKIFDVLQ